MSVLSYNQIIELFEVISESHYQIKRFGTGELSEADINKFISENSTYPVFWATPVSVNTNPNTINYNFNLLFFDIVKKDKNNEQEVLSDTLQIALDVFRILKLEDDQFFVDGEPTISPFAGRYSEWVAGWSMEISIQVNFQENLCDIPYDGLNLTQILQNFTGGNIDGFGCDDLGTCIDFINLENSVSVALGGIITGGTYSSATTTLNLFNTTGGTIQITGFTNGGTSFNCNDLLNCAVITTLTGDVQTLQTQIVSAVSGGSYSAGTLTLNTIGNTPIDITGFSNSNVDTLVTAFTYNNSNVLTIEQNNSQPPLSVLINQVTGWTSTGDVNISGNTNVNGYVQFFTASTAISSVARLTWNDVDGTLDLGLKGGNVTLQIGQEEVIRVVNKTGSNLLESNYQVVRIRTSSEGGAQGQRLAVLLAQANNKLNHSGILGIVTENIDNNQEGFITSFGNVRNINTTGSLQGETWIDGDNLWLSETVAGRLTNIQPQNHPVQIGYVLYAHPNQGKIFVKVDEGIDELSELHDVNVTGATDGQVLTYSASTGLWVPRTPTSGDVSNKYDKSGGTISGDVFIQSGLTANTINISSTPTLNNNPTQLLSRNNVTGEIEYTNASQYLNEASTDQLYGSGFDGNVVLDGTNTYSSFTTKVGNVYTLIRTLYASAITINNGVKLESNGFGIFCNGTLTIDDGGILSANGNNGNNGGSGTGSPTAGGTSRQAIGNNYIVINTGGAGGIGGNTSTAGGNSVVTVNYLGGIGGSGGLGVPVGSTATTTGVRGVVTVSAGILQQPYSSQFNLTSLTLGTIQPWNAGSGAGGAVGTNISGGLQGAGGGGGSAGRGVFIYSKNLILSGSTSIIQSNGGNGGNGGAAPSGNVATGGGGGGGAGGGFVLILSNNLNYTPNNQIQAKGGIGGTGGLGRGTFGGTNYSVLNSASGSNGVDGYVVIINPVTGSNITYTGQY